MGKAKNRICGTCPFRTDSGRGCDDPKYLGYGKPETFIAQLTMPFLIPCHAHIDYDDPDWHEKASKLDQPQCVGAAELRRKTMLDPDKTLADLMPDSILRTEDGEVETQTFASVVGFFAHHTGLDADAALWTVMFGLDGWRYDELQRAGSTVLSMEKV